jgi:ubiquitin-conjugating enzyme E2 J2
MAARIARNRLRKEAQKIKADPPPFIVARPQGDNLFEWLFVLTLPADHESDYRGGQYVGKLMFPSNYPTKPPGIKMLTPSGRFETDVRICLSVSDFHPESWSPMWSSSTVLVGLLSFMLGEEETTGSICTEPDERRALAEASHEWNASHPTFRRSFPELLVAAGRASSGAAEAKPTGKAPAGKAPAGKAPAGKTRGTAKPRQRRIDYDDL